MNTPNTNDDFERLAYDYFHDNEPLLEEGDEFFKEYSEEALVKMRAVLARNFHSQIDKDTIKTFDLHSGVDPEKHLAQRLVSNRLSWWILERYQLAKNVNASRARGIDERTSLMELSDILYEAYLSGMTAEEVYNYYLWLLQKNALEPDYTIEEFREWCVEGGDGSEFEW